MTPVTVYCSTSFEWKDNTGMAEESKLVMVGGTGAPDGWRGIAIQSAKTGKIMFFTPVPDPSENGYDGEFMIYSCADKYFVQIWNY